MGRAELIEAIKAGEEESVRTMLVEEPGLTEARDDHGVSLILVAVYHGKPEIARLIASRRTELDLFEACGLGDVDRVDRILDSHPDAATSYSPDGFPLLGYAAFFGHAPLVRRLVDMNVDVNIEADNPMKVRPLHSAVAFRNPETALEMARILLEAGADPNTRQQMGYSALQSAALHGNRPLVDLLLEKGADPAQRSDDGKSPADMARQGGFEEIAALLDKAG